MEEEENLCKVETNDGDLYLQIRQKFDQTEFDLVVTDGCSIWNTTGTNCFRIVLMIHSPHRPSIACF